MSMQDPIADMLTRIRNASKATHPDVSFPASKVKIAILGVLKQEGYITDFSQGTDENQKPNITVTLKYFNNKPVIALLRRISKTGLREFSRVADMPEVMDKLGIVIVSTSKGIMTGRQARALGHGGEILCEVA